MDNDQTAMPADAGMPTEEEKKHTEGEVEGGEETATPADTTETVA